MARTSYCIVCDDIRKEADGRVSLMGVYDGVVDVDTIPGSIQKLCFLARVESLPDNPLAELSVRVTEPGGETRVFSAPKERIAEFNEILRPSDGSRMINFQIMISPFEIRAEGNLIVEIMAETGVINTSEVRFRLAEDDRDLVPLTG